MVADSPKVRPRPCLAPDEIVAVGGDDDVGAGGKRVGPDLRLPWNPEAFSRRPNPVEDLRPVRRKVASESRRGHTENFVLLRNGFENACAELLLTAEENVHWVCFSSGGP